jgi:sec-independent protein translocase protein TatA
MFSRIGSTELLIIALILLILFGGRKLPELGKGLGESVKEFRKSIKKEPKTKKK